VNAWRGSIASLKGYNDLRHLEHVVAALKGVEAQKERVILDAPRVLRALRVCCSLQHECICASFAAAGGGTVYLVVEVRKRA